MKRYILITALCILSFYQSFATDKSKSIPSSIKEVTVFFSGAQITREADVTIESGITRCVFSGMPFGIDPNSILIGGGNEATILDVQYQINYLETQKKSANIKALQDSIERLGYEIQTVRDQKYALDQELDVLMNNKKAGGDQNLDPLKLEQLLNLFKKRIPAIKEDQMRLARKEKKLIEDQSKFSNQLGEINATNSLGVPEILLTLKSEKSRNFKMELQYFIQGAHWAPKYDIRVANVHSPLKLLLKADIVNSTGENWDQVKLHMATSNPNLSSTKPNLSTWFLYPYVKNNTYKRLEKQSKNSEMLMAPSSTMDGGVSNMNDKEVEMYDQFETRTGTLHLNFDLNMPYTVNGQGKVQTVEVKAYEINAIYEVSTAPKLDKAAFLMARFTGADELSQLGGEAQLFFENTFVGKSYIEATSEDTVSIGLGRFNSITIDRKKVKTESGKSFLGGIRKEEIKFEISIKNNGIEETELFVQDQIPVSTEKDVEIELLDGKSADFNATTGMLHWKIKLAPGKTQKLVFGYRVKSPSDRQYILE